MLLIGKIVTGIFAIVFLAMFKGFIEGGVSIAAAQFLFKDVKDDDVRGRTLKWLANGKEILAQLKLMDKHMAEDEKAAEKLSKKS